MNANNRDAVTPLSRTEQAAMVLMSLDREEAVAVMRELPPESVQRLSAAMLNLQDCGQDTIHGVLHQFLMDVGQASSVRSFSHEHLRGMLDEALGRERGRLLGERVAAVSADSQIAKLRWLDAHSVADILRQEHPQLQAVMLACLSPEQGGQVLLSLPEEQRRQLLERLARLESISSFALEELDAVLAGHLSQTGVEVKQRLQGERVAADLLKSLSAQDESDLLGAMAQQDPQRAARVEAMMFGFADLLQLPTAELAKVLSPLAVDLLAIAAWDLPLADRNRMMAALARAPAKRLAKLLSTSPAPGRRAVEEARAEIVGVARKMADIGEIVIDMRKLAAA